jgi:hypothetical protein
MERHTKFDKHYIQKLYEFDIHYTVNLFVLFVCLSGKH